MRKYIGGLLAFALGVLAASATFAEGRDADTVFDNFCFSCHSTGWDNAPVIGDPFAWEDRRAKGIEVLLQNTVEGFNAMPPLGGCNDCTEDELRTVIEMLIDE